jgi:TetR/AcrR family transcriptional regulator, fatty acid biosynthesis regulator
MPMTGEPIRPTREPGRRGKQGETRARLIQVTIDVVRAEGLSALTTSRITRAAGIAQPGFYAHFKNVDDLVRTAVSQVVEEMREKIGAARRRTFERFKTVVDAAGIDATTRAAYDDALDVFLSDPTFAELFLRYRRDPSLLGGYMREAMEHVRQDLTLDVWRNARRLGFRDEHYPQVTFWAEQILGLFFTTAEALLDGRYTDRAMLVDHVARSSSAILRVQMRAAGLGSPPKP